MMETNFPTVRTIRIEEFGIYESLADFPLDDCPSYLQEGIGAVCLSGSAIIQVFENRSHVQPDSVIVLIPWQLASIREVSDDFRIVFFRISQHMFNDSLSTLWRLTPEFFFYMHKHFVSEPVGGNARRFTNYCNLLAYRAETAPVRCRRESIMQLLRVLYWDVYTVYVDDPHAGRIKYSRKEELAFRFMRLVIEQHSPGMDVAHYAERLGVSAKYLTTLMKRISGRSAREWIVYFTILEIKSLLRESSMDLKMIVSRVNFADQSSLCRFFRHYTGMSPSQYRKSIHF